jgi:hypothetical protein
MSRAKRLREALTSLKLTLTCLGTLMALVFACTLAQVKLGTFAAIDLYMHSFLVYARLPGTLVRLPVFPGGALVGLALLVNLLAVLFWRFQWTKRKAGILLIHCGLILLIGSQFVTGVLAVESQMPIEEGSSKNYTEEASRAELAIVDASNPDYDEVTSIPEPLLRGHELIAAPSLPFTALVKRWYPNSILEPRAADDRGAPSIANRGVGPGLSVRPAPRATADDQVNSPAAFVELLDGDRTLGTWLVSNDLSQPQAIRYLGREFQLTLRPTRRYLPFTLALKSFRHDIYPGTDIPKNFSSLVRILNPARHEDRDALIYMNNPLRYEGLTFYQSSFGKNDKLSILQVVKNPGWRLPYAACALVAAGLLIQFLSHLLSFVPEQGP